MCSPPPVRRLFSSAQGTRDRDISFATVASMASLSHPDPSSNPPRADARPSSGSQHAAGPPWAAVVGNTLKSARRSLKLKFVEPSLVDGRVQFTIPKEVV